MNLLTRFFLLIVFIFSAKTFAFTFNNSVGAAFDHDNVKIHFAQGKCENIGWSDSEIMLMVSEGMDKFWNTAPTSRLKLERGELKIVSNDFKTEAICSGSNPCTPNTALTVNEDILISCNQNATNFPSAAILGKTLTNNIEGTTLKGSLFLINDIASTTVATLSREEMVAFLAHEIGHAIGLGHSPKANNLMYYKSSPYHNSLGQDDIDGISYLYPKQQPDLGCGTVIFNSDQNRMNFLFMLAVIFLITAIPNLRGKSSSLKLRSNRT